MKPLQPWVHAHRPRLWAFAFAKRTPLRNLALAIWTRSLTREALRRAATVHQVSD